MSKNIDPFRSSACSLRYLSSKLGTEKNVNDRKQAFRNNLEAPNHLETSKLKILRRKKQKRQQTKRHKHKISLQNHAVQIKQNPPKST